MIEPNYDAMSNAELRAYCLLIIIEKRLVRWSFLPVAAGFWGGLVFPKTLEE
jgi:hypothetical protein